VRIHLACGKHILEGWVNCDIEKHSKAPKDPDIFCDVSEVPLPDLIADEVMAIHILEHFYHWEVPKVLAEWNRLLKVGGKLSLEMPDIMKAARNLIDGCDDQMAMWPIYGDQTLENPLMCHKWGWTFKTLKPVLEAAGFTEVTLQFPEWHGRKTMRDFRVEAIKC